MENESSILLGNENNSVKEIIWQTPNAWKVKPILNLAFGVLLVFVTLILNQSGDLVVGVLLLIFLMQVSLPYFIWKYHVDVISRKIVVRTLLGGEVEVPFSIIREWSVNKIWMYLLPYIFIDTNKGRLIYPLQIAELTRISWGRYPLSEELNSYLNFMEKNVCKKSELSRLSLSDAIRALFWWI